jgi:hypothetical protein
MRVVGRASVGQSVKWSYWLFNTYNYKIMDDFKTVFLFTDYASAYNIGHMSGRSLGLYLSLFSFLAILFVVFKAFLFPDMTFDKSQSNLIVGRESTLLIYCVLIIFGLVWSALSEPDSDYNDLYLSLVDIYNTQQYEIAEGVVHVLHIQEYLGHDQADIVRIDDVEFEVNFYYRSFGYTTSISHGGALAEGTYARVFYTLVKYSEDSSENLILRIDVKR